ncbi:MAG: TetR/AcrR family transcriptional regulator [Corynebacteriales bacterium]|uniref:TetR/AcrR family transcriptional regulator n=1 Tax=Williamsia herbipolensis TaxID=1603258 RepID=A0AAU4K451_9NOCA|nr:TetR/AcrR family transcriptional regulator [Williamsia herbipolensis]MCX6469494.1 TetR/AcrR family transcriptional regulator [Mycobacteriales bacterium]
MPHTSATSTELPRGRPRDPSRDAAITDAAIELLIRTGYDRLTVEGVAAEAGVGKATVYRRWKSKADLVIDAMATLKPVAGAIDTGSLDEDIEQMAAVSCSPQSQRLLQVMTSVCSALSREPDLLEAFRTRFTEPRIERLTEILDRARRRGELAPHIDVAMAASLLPSLMLHRALTTGRPAGRAYAEQIVSTVLRPVLGLPARPSTPHPKETDD